MNRRLACLPLLLAATVLTASAGPASAAGLGPAPGWCTVPDAAGCVTKGGGGEVKISPHVVHAGHKYTVTLESIDGEYGGVAPGYGLTGPGCTGKIVDKDGDPFTVSKGLSGSATCTYTAGDPTNVWQIVEVPFSVRYGGLGSEDGDFFAVVGKQPYIDGTVTGSDGKPIVGAKIAIKGAHGSYHAETNTAGYYDKQVAKGSYEVTPSGGGTFKPKAKKLAADYDKTATANFMGEVGLSISGHVNITCEEQSCKGRKGAKGITLVATGGKAPAQAVTDGKGAYSIDDLDPDTTYRVTPQLEGGRSADPAYLDVPLAKKSVSGKDFGVCGVEEAGARSVSPARRCQRLYTIRLSSWIPQRSIADPFLGAEAFDGSDFPNHPNSLSLTGYHRFPPCLTAGQVQALRSAPDFGYRASFLGANHAGYAGANLGTVSIPFAFTGQRTAEGRILQVRPLKTTVGSITRVYDYSATSASRVSSSPSCSVTRRLAPATSVKIIDKNHFQIDVTWPLPFSKYEDATDLADFRLLPKTDFKKKLTDQVDAALKQIPGYKDLPAYLQGKVKDAAVAAASKGGLKTAVDGIKGVIEKIGKLDKLVDKLEPPYLGYPAKALAIVNSLEYGSPDLEIKGTISTTLQDVVSVHLEATSDAFPSFGMQVVREFNQPELLPWQGPGPDYVLNDASTGSYSESLLQGAAGRAQIVDGLGGFTRPGAFSPFPTQHDPAQLHPRTLDYQFVGERSR